MDNKLQNGGIVGVDSYMLSDKEGGVVILDCVSDKMRKMLERMSNEPSSIEISINKITVQQ